MGEGRRQRRDGDKQKNPEELPTLKAHAKEEIARKSERKAGGNGVLDTKNFKANVDSVKC